MGVPLGADAAIRAAPDPAAADPAAAGARRAAVVAARRLCARRRIAAATRATTTRSTSIPIRPDTIWSANTNLEWSRDGGKTFSAVPNLERRARRLPRRLDRQERSQSHHHRQRRRRLRVVGTKAGRGGTSRICRSRSTTASAWTTRSRSTTSAAARRTTDRSAGRAGRSTASAFARATGTASAAATDSRRAAIRTIRTSSTRRRRTARSSGWICAPVRARRSGRARAGPVRPPAAVGEAAGAAPASGPTGTRPTSSARITARGSTGAASGCTAPTIAATAGRRSAAI